MLPLREYLGLFPVLVRRGLARGAWWSVYPHSSYWRHGGNDDAVAEIVRRHGARPGLVCWDIGAHYGIHAVGLARAVGPAGRVEAFEPDPVSFRRLAWHRRLNRLTHLHLHPVAVSDRTGSASLFTYEGFGGTSSHLAFTGENTAGVASTSIASIRLDDWVDAGRIRPPGFIKVDVEGHAGPALRGAARTLAQHRPVLLVAIHTLEERNEATACLEAAGYRCEPLGELRAPGAHFGEMVALPANP